MVRALTSRTRGHRALVAVGLVFATAAGALAYGLVVRPASAVARARGWDADACTVLSVTVRRLSRNAYDLDLAYEWRRGDRSFRGGRFDFFGRALEEPQDWAPVLERLRPGQLVTCFVDPARPDQAVIDRDWKGGVLMPAVVLSVFVLTLVGVGYAAISPRADAAARPAALSAAPAEPAGPIALSPRSTPRRRLGRAAVSAVLFNATAALLFVALVLPGWREGRPSWPLTLFVGVVALGGLTQLARAARALAGLAGPTVVVTARAEAHLGERLVVEWRVEPRPNLITDIELALVGREIARYPDWDANQQQVDRVEKAEFFRGAFSTDRTGDTWAAGRAGIDIPRALPPSLDAPSNAIAWAVVLRAGVRQLPDLAEEYPIRLRPPRRVSS
jgi:hypothetical protein